MTIWERVKDFFANQVDLKILLKVFLLLLIVLTAYASRSMYENIWDLCFRIVLPFLIAFAIAYVTHPLVSFLESKRIPKGLGITLFWMFLLVILGLILVLLVPMLYTKIMQLVASLSDSIRWIMANADLDGTPSAIISSLSTYVLQILNNVSYWLPNLTNTIPKIISQLLGGMGQLLLVFIIAVYMMIDYEKIRNGILNVSYRIHRSLPSYVSAVDEVVGVYVRSMLLLMVIKFVEYSLLYYLIGHKDWMIIALLTAIGLAVPYIGATIANAIGILTSLTLPLSHVCCLIVGIIILANLDAYVIAPMVHSRRSLLQPLWTLFAIIAGGIVAGPAGILVSVPCFLAIRTCIQTYQLRHVDPIDPTSKRR